MLLLDKVNYAALQLANKSRTRVSFDLKTCRRGYFSSLFVTLYVLTADSKFPSCTTQRTTGLSSFHIKIYHEAYKVVFYVYIDIKPRSCFSILVIIISVSRKISLTKLHKVVV